MGKVLSFKWKGNNYIYIFNLPQFIRRKRGKAQQLLKACLVCLVRLLHWILPRVLQRSHYYPHQTFLMVTDVWITSPSEFLEGCTSQAHRGWVFGYKSHRPLPHWALSAGVRTCTLFPCDCTGGSMCSRWQGYRMVEPPSPARSLNDCMEQSYLLAYNGYVERVKNCCHVKPLRDLGVVTVPQYTLS